MVALSSIEADYVALSLTAREATWLQLLLPELRLLAHVEKFAEIHVHENNKCAKTILLPPCQDKSIIPEQTNPLSLSVQDEFRSAANPYPH